jgi:histidinol dehydrogenase
LVGLAPHVVAMANAEGLSAHAASVEWRVGEKSGAGIER